MAADAERNRFHVKRVRADQVTMLWTAQSYRADVLAALEAIRGFADWAPLSELCRNKIGPGPHPEYTEYGHPCLKTQNVSDGLIVDPTPSGWADQTSLPRFRKYRVHHGDVLVNVTGAGSIGRAAVYLGYEEPLTNQHIACLAPRDDVDGAYLAAFLNTSVGQRAIEQGITGATGQLNLLTEHLQCIPVIRPTRQAQRYIGAKVRQAEALREWARAAEKAARELYIAEVTKRGPTDLPYHQTFRTRLHERLDPEFYQPRYARVLDAPWLASAADPLGKLVVAGSYGCLPDSGTYGTGSERLLRATDLDDCAWNPGSGVRVPTGEVAAKALVGEGDVLLEVKGAMTRCVVAHGHAVGAYVNGTVYRFKASIDPWYLAVHLTGPVKELYCSRESVNNIILYLNLDSIRSLPVLRLGEDVERRIGASFRQSTLATGVSRSLVTAARLLVEALIERRVTEAELIAAGKNADADRALMTRLREDGVDGDGEPLFPDLDVVSEVLDAVSPGGAV
jgi:type I restriction enzyme S subunit